MNRETAQEFVTTIRRRESNYVEGNSDEPGNQVDAKGNQVDEFGTDLDTGLRHSGTDLDTGLRHSDTDLSAKLGDGDPKRMRMSQKQKDIVNFCSVPRTTKEILDRIGVSMHTKNRERYITSLVSAGYLEMTNPENPTASNQKYRKRLRLGKKG